jgi:lipopolysaccharide heptosyltransferase II
MSTPAIRALKETVPGRKITVLTSSYAAKIARYIPEIDEVIEFNVPWIKMNGRSPSAKTILDLVANLKKRKFDAAVIFTAFSQNSQPTALICYLAEIAHVLSYSRENPYSLISNWVVDNEPFVPLIHQVERDLRLVATVGATTSKETLSLQIPEGALTSLQKKIAAKGIDLNNKWFIMHPGVSEIKRRYPPKLFAKVGKLLVQDGYQILLTGSLSERELTIKIQEEIGSEAVSLAAVLSLEEFIALTSLTPVLITNNTGPAHIAAALQRPVVDLYALTNPQHTPWMTKSRVLYFSVLNTLKSKNVLLKAIEKDMESLQRDYPTPEEVAAAAKELLTK